MDTSMLQPLIGGGLLVAIVAAAANLRASLDGELCPECPHCRAEAEDRRARADVEQLYARRRRPDDEDERHS
jgi:hypothetical protein